MNEKPVHQRKLKNLLIHPRFQLTLIMINVAVTVLVMAYIYWQVTDVEEYLVKIGRVAHPEYGPEYFDFIVTTFKSLQKSIFIIAAEACLFSAVLTLLVSHKMAGPFFKLKKYFLDLREGRTREKLTFRKEDYFEDLPPVINDVLAGITTEKK